MIERRENQAWLGFWRGNARLWPATALLAVALGSSTPSRAEPTIWERVKSPQATKAAALYRWADSERVPREELLRGPRSEKLHLDQAALRIQLNGGEELGDTSLQYLLAHCLANGTGELFVQAVPALERALAAAPEHPLAAEAWYDLGNMLEVLGERERAAGAYTAALRLEWDHEARASIYRARAQLSMNRGQLLAAEADYRAAIEHSRDPKLRALANWGLAVALDRNFDFPAAAPLALQAYHSRFNAGRRSVLDLEDGILWPPAEEHYYRGLALLAEADEKQGGDGYVSTLLASQLMWMRYLDDAPADGPWIARARQHLAKVRALVDAMGLDDDDQDPLP